MARTARMESAAGSQAALRTAGATVHTATSAVAALRALSHDVAPSVIVADVVVPGHDGVWMARQLRKRPRGRHVPVIGNTARSLRKLPSGWTDVGFTVMRAKPNDPLHLAAVVPAHGSDAG